MPLLLWRPEETGLHRIYRAHDYAKRILCAFDDAV